jgi:hypothetical protein
MKFLLVPVVRERRHVAHADEDNVAAVPAVASGGPPRAFSLVRSQRITPSPPFPAAAYIFASSTNAILA